MSLPRLSSGKVSLLQLPSSSEMQKILYGKDSQPLNAIEKQICQIFSDVLCLDHVPCRGNFTNLGGNSQLAIKVTAQIEEYLHCNIPIDAVFSNPDVTSLAAYIQTHCNTVEPHLSKPQVS